MASVYEVNKGIGKPVVFRGLKAQWIWWLGAGIVGLLLLFALLYISGVSLMICISLVLMLGSLLFVFVYRLSNKYGEHGLMKEMARRSVPEGLKGCSSLRIKKELCDAKRDGSVADLVG